jgi:hypothetical protein
VLVSYCSLLRARIFKLVSFKSIFAVEAVDCTAVILQQRLHRPYETKCEPHRSQLRTTGSNGNSSTSFNGAKPKGVLRFDAIWDSNSTSTSRSSGTSGIMNNNGSGSNSNGETVIRRRYHLLHYLEDGTSELRR